MDGIETTKTYLQKRKVKILLVIIGIFIYQTVVLEVVKFISPRMDYLVSGKSVYLLRGSEGENCVNKSIKLSQKKFPLTALASFQGSRSTFVRHLVQQVTGYATGSMYRIGKEKLDLFPGLDVGDGINDNRVLLINTHQPLSKVPKAFQIPFDKAVLLLRNPYDTVKANYEFKKTGSYHKTVEIESLLSEEWRKFAKSETYKWRNFILDWLQFKGSLFILRYETIEKDVMLTISRLLTFLQLPVTDKTVPDIICMTKQSKGFLIDVNSEYNRSFVEVFPEPLQRTIQEIRIKVFRAVKKRICLRKEIIS